MTAEQKFLINDVEVPMEQVPTEYLGQFYSEIGMILRRRRLEYISKTIKEQLNGDN